MLMVFTKYLLSPYFRFHPPSRSLWQGSSQLCSMLLITMEFRARLHVTCSFVYPASEIASAALGPPGLFWTVYGCIVAAQVPCNRGFCFTLKIVVLIISFVLQLWRLSELLIGFGSKRPKFVTREQARVSAAAYNKYTRRHLGAAAIKTPKAEATVARTTMHQVIRKAKPVRVYLTNSTAQSRL